MASSLRRRDDRVVTHQPRSERRTPMERLIGLDAHRPSATCAVLDARGKSASTGGWLEGEATACERRAHDRQQREQSRTGCPRRLDAASAALVRRVDGTDVGVHRSVLRRPAAGVVLRDDVDHRVDIDGPSVGVCRTIDPDVRRGPAVGRDAAPSEAEQPRARGLADPVRGARRRWARVPPAASGHAEVPAGTARAHGASTRVDRRVDQHHPGLRARVSGRQRQRRQSHQDHRSAPAPHRSHYSVSR